VSVKVLVSFRLTYLVSFPLDPKDVKEPKSGGQSGTLIKEQGSHDLASDCGAQKMHLKAYVHWDQKDSNQIIIYICNIRLSLSICLCLLSSSSIIYSN